MLPMGRICFPLIIAPFKMPGFFYRETYSTIQKLIFDDTDTKSVCSFIADCVTEFKAVFRGLMFWRLLFLIPPIAPIKYPPNLNVLQYIYSSPSKQCVSLLLTR